MDSEARSVCRKVKSSCKCDKCRSRKTDSWLRAKRPSLFPMCDQFRKAYLEDDQRNLERLETLFQHVRCICCGYTLLHLAVSVASRELVERYLSSKADVAVRTDGGETALHLACVLDDSWFAERLLAHEAELAQASDEIGCTPLQLCLSLDEPPREILRLLLANGARPNRLFEGGVDEMLRANAKNSAGVLPLYEAVHKGDHDAARRLLRDGACPDCLGLFRRTLLQVASFNGNVECAEALVEAGVNINESDLEGRTALHHAVISESAEIVNLLLRNKCDMWARDSDGYTALGMAALTNRRRVTDGLLDHGARCTESLLLEALERRCTDTALAILRRGYLRVQGNKFGRTLLYCAVMTEQHEVVEYLQSIGVEVEFEGSEDDEEAPSKQIRKVAVEPTRKRSHLPAVTSSNCKLTKYSRGNFDAPVSGPPPRRDKVIRHKKERFLLQKRVTSVTGEKASAKRSSNAATRSEVSSGKVVSPSVKLFIKSVSRKPSEPRNVDYFFRFYCEKQSSKSTLTTYEGVCRKSLGKDENASSNVDTFFKFYKYCVQ